MGQRKPTTVWKIRPIRPIRLLLLTCRTLNNRRTFVVTFSRNERDARQVFLLMISLSRVILTASCSTHAFLRLSSSCDTRRIRRTHPNHISSPSHSIFPSYYLSFTPVRLALSDNVYRHKAVIRGSRSSSPYVLSITGTPVVAFTIQKLD
jgi:hypothetical protein